MSRRFVREVRINRPPAEVFAWHERAGALPRLTPPWEQVQVEHEGGGLAEGARAVLKSRVGPFWVRWVAEHHDTVAGQQFCDRQIQGPFARWDHCHRFLPDGQGGCLLRDEIEYELPGGVLGAMAAGFVEERLDRMFTYRHAVTQADLEYGMKSRGTVVISGASGLIGGALVPYLQTQGWNVKTLVRRTANHASEIGWNPEKGTVDWPMDFSCDAVIHLAGAGIADGPWTEKRKRVIRESRLEGTRTLVSALDRLAKPPSVMLGGSAIGYYGANTGSQEVDETAVSGDGFLAELCRDWEAEAAKVGRLGTRWVALRTGIVLTPRGGALGKMLPAFQWGLGGPIAGGAQWQSWISLDDWVRACAHVMDTPAACGPLNVVAPHPVQQLEFADTLGQVLRRPTVLPLPAWPLRLVLGQMADEALLASQRVMPRTLLHLGFKFLHPSLEKAFRHVLGRQSLL